jgi:hypothetical protein
VWERVLLLLIASYLLLMARLGKKDQMMWQGKKNSGPKDDVVVLNIEVEHFFG